MDKWNKKTEIAQEECKLEDKDIISDVLGAHKQLVKLYSTALCETNCDQLRGLIKYQLSECADDQFDAFNYMSERGLYPTDQAPEQKIDQARQKFCTCENEMRK